MISYLKTLFAFLFVAAFLFACEGSYDALVEDQLEENPTPEPISGDAGAADFSNYVAIGNSLTAGYMDGALYNLGQEYSLAALIHQQMQYAGAPGNFNQPDINSELGFNTSVEQPQGGPTLGRFKLDTNIPGPSPTIGGDPIAPYDGNTSELNNFGVPGILLGQLLTPATGGPQSDPAFNPFYWRFASSPGASTILGDAIATQPSFFTLWIGNNDVLGYAISGASNPALLTDPGDFTSQFNAVISQLEATGAKGVVANIPSLLGVPYFQAISYDAIPLDEETSNQLNAGYTDYNNGVNQAQQGGIISEDEAERRQIEFTAGDNAFVIIDESLTDVPNLPKYRQAEPTDLFTLPLGSILGENLGNGPYGLQDQVVDQYVLIPQEQQEIEMARAQFNNTIINAIVNKSDFALYNTNHPNSAFADLFGVDGELGIRVQGTLLQPDFSPNGVFSTDGIHPNPRGNAILANEFIEVIEEAFGASIPEVDVLNLPSVQLCAGDCASQQQGKAVAENITFGISAK